MLNSALNSGTEVSENSPETIMLWFVSLKLPPPTLRLSFDIGILL